MASDFSREFCDDDGRSVESLQRRSISLAREVTIIHNG
jgi:hypothetical protein